ncbi:Transposase C of IS166 homeodomain-containing protein, partial [Novosphingobium sp. B1]
MVPGDAPDELLQLRAELALAREQAEQARDKALVAEAEVAKVWAINADLLARNAHLELMNEQMRRDKYGARSERSRRLLDQLELTFEELEANASEAELLGQIAAAKTTTVQAFTRKRSTRRDFPADLPREQVTIRERTWRATPGFSRSTGMPASMPCSRTAART